MCLMMSLGNHGLAVRKCFGSGIHRGNASEKMQKTGKILAFCIKYGKIYCEELYRYEQELVL